MTSEGYTTRWNIPRVVPIDARRRRPTGVRDVMSGRRSAARVCPGRCPFVIPERSTANYRLVMVFALAELALVALIIGLLVLGGWAAWAALRSGPPGPGGPRLAPRPRAQLAAAIAQARWEPGHDEVDGVTRVLVRRTYTGLDGFPTVLEERVLESFPAADPAWEALFTEAMAKARYRCAYLNAEESH